MFGVATIGGRIGRRAAGRPSAWTRDYLGEVPLADRGCAVVGSFIAAFIAARLGFGNNVTAGYLTLPVLWIAALGLAPLTIALIAAIWPQDRGPGLFTRLMVGKSRRLRRRSAEELPRLFTAFPGRLPLVGPCPALPDEAEGYAKHVCHRLVVKPYLTGRWQVNGRPELSWTKSVQLAPQILGKTIPVLVKGREPASGISGVIPRAQTRAVVGS